MTVEFQQAWPYVVTVYIGIWFILIGYLVVLGVQVARLRKELGAIRASLDRKSSQTEK